MIVKSTKRNETKENQKHERKLNFGKNLAAAAITKHTALTYIVVRVHTSTENSSTFNIKTRKKLRGVITHTHKHIHVHQMSLFSANVLEWFMLNTFDARIKHQQ